MLIEPSDAPGARGRARTGPRTRARSTPSLASGSIAAAIPSSSSVLRAGRRRHLVPLEHASLAVDRSGEDLRAAEIDADDSFGAHGPRLPYPAGWRTERSPTGSTRAAGRGGRCRPRPRPERPESEPTRRRGDGAGRPRWGRRIGLACSRWSCSLVVWVVAGYLSFRSGVADANERLPKAVEAGLAPQEGAARLEAVADPAARHRRRPDGRARRRPPLRLDPARPHRPRPAPARLPLDPARPPRRHPRLRPEQDQRRLPARRPGADDADGPRAHRPAAEPRRHGRLRRLPQRHRRARRGRDRRAEADPLEPLRLPLRDRGALPAVAGLALREGQADDERPARADLLARPREPARPRPTTT